MAMQAKNLGDWGEQPSLVGCHRSEDANRTDQRAGGSGSQVETRNMSQADEERVGPPSRVLVVDPDEALRIVLEDAVRDLDHEVVAGASPRDAMAALDGMPFDVVILGIEDPPADAVRLARWIKSKHHGIDLIVIADPSVVSVAEAKRLGAFDILTRPLQDPGLVTASIDRVLEKRGLESEPRRAREGSLLSEAGQVIGSSLDIEEVYDVFVERIIRNLIPSDGLSINLIDALNGSFSTAYRRGPTGLPEGLGTPGSLAGSISADVVESGAPSSSP